MLGRRDRLVRLPQQLLGLLVLALRGAHQAERHRRRGERAHVVWADGLPRGQREALRLVYAALLEQELRERALRLAQRRAVLERRQDPDRLAEEALGARQVALVARRPGGEVQRPAERPSRTGLDQVLARRLERGVRVVELAPLQVQLPREAQRPAARFGAAALLGEQDRLLDERRGPVELQPREVDARELVRGLALEVLALRLAREVERLEHHLFLLGEVAAHPGDRCARPQRAVAAGQVVGLEDRQRVVDHLLSG